MAEICTGPPILWGGNLISGFSVRTIRRFGTGIVTAGCAAVMNACFMVISFILIIEYPGLAAR